jgi:hypothetical protein
MQNIEQKLKELKSISPDAGYTRRSRSLLVEAPITQKPLSPWRVLVTSFQFGSAIALTAVLLLVIIGGFSAWKMISPFRLGSLDPASLQAEAEAIDIQIELTNLAYPEVNRGASAETTPRTTQAAPAPTTEAASSEATVGVDEALDILAE